MPEVSVSLLSRFVSRNKDRLVVLLLLAMAGGMIYYALLSLHETVEDVVKKNIPLGEGKEKPADVTGELDTLFLNRPLEEYGGLVQNNVFVPSVIRNQKTQQVRDLYAKAEDLFRQSRWADSAALFRQVQQLDPAENVIVYRVTPTDYLSKIDQAQKKESLLNLFTQAQTALRKADETGRAGQKAEELTLYQQVVDECSRLLTMDPDKTVASPEVYQKSAEWYQEAQKNVQQLTKETFRDQVEGHARRGDDFYSQRENNADNYAQARDEWATADQLIREKDPHYEIVDAQLHKQIQERLQKVNAEILQLKPKFVAQAEALFQKGKAANDNGDLRKALDLWKTIQKFDPTASDVAGKITLVQAEIDRVEKAKALGLADELLQTAKTNYQQALQDYQNQDFDNFELHKAGGIKAILQLLGMSLPELEPKRDEAQKMRAELEGKQVPPALQGYHYIGFRQSGNVYMRQIKEEGRGGQPFWVYDDRPSTTGLKVEKADPGNQWIEVSKLRSEARRTRLNLEAQ